MADELKRFYQALNDRELNLSLPADREFYVGDLHRHGEAADTIAVLQDRILWDNGGGAYLFTGQRGTGKTTELMRLAYGLKKESCSVIYVDIVDHLDLTSPINLSDFLITLFGAVADKVKTDFGLDVIADGFWSRLSEFLLTEVKFERLNLSQQTPGGFKAELQGALLTDPDFKRQLQQKIQGHSGRLVKESRQFAREVAEAVRGKQKTARFVIIVDSLEQLRTIGSESEEVFASVNALFGQAERLHFEGVHVVYSIPPYLLAMAGSLGAYYTGGMVYALCGIHLFTARSPKVSRDGLDKMVQIIARRFADWSLVIDRPVLELVAVASGGDIRDFLRMLRLCLAELNGSRRAGVPLGKITVELVASAKNQLLRDMLPLAESDKIWLRKIGETHEACLPTPKDLPTLARFFESKFVLNYRNGDDWYDIHPILREHIGLIPPAIDPAT